MKKSWERVTQILDFKLCAQLNIQFDAERLAADAHNILERFPPMDHLGQEIREGHWGCVGLITSGGKLEATRLVPGQPLKETEALAHAPYIRSILDDLPCEKSLIRLIVRAPGNISPWHQEFDRCLRHGFARCHIPVRNHPDFRVQISDKKYYFKPGEMWCGDFAFPHRAENLTPLPRIHLVGDFVVNEAFGKLFPDGFLRDYGQKKKALARVMSYRLFQWDSFIHNGWKYPIKSIAKKLFPDLHSKLKEMKMRKLKPEPAKVLDRRIILDALQQSPQAMEPS